VSSKFSFFILSLSNIAETWTSSLPKFPPTSLSFYAVWQHWLPHFVEKLLTLINWYAFHSAVNNKQNNTRLILLVKDTLLTGIRTGYIQSTK
jgi:hypothetical protein